MRETEGGSGLERGEDLLVLGHARRVRDKAQHLSEQEVIRSVLSLCGANVCHGTGGGQPDMALFCGGWIVWCWLRVYLGNTHSEDTHIESCSKSESFWIIQIPFGGSGRNMDLRILYVGLRELVNILVRALESKIRSGLCPLDLVLGRPRYSAVRESSHRSYRSGPPNNGLTRGARRGRWRKGINKCK